MSDTLFFAKFADCGLYATGPQRSGAIEIAGGPIGYVLREDAEAMATAIQGTVVERPVEEVLAFCQAKGYTLWLKKADGGMSFVAIPEHPGEMERVNGELRESAIKASGRR